MIFAPSRHFKAKRMGRLTALKLKINPNSLSAHYYDHLYQMRHGWIKPKGYFQLYRLKRRLSVDYCCPICDYRKNIVTRKGYKQSERAWRYRYRKPYRSYLEHGIGGIKFVRIGED